MEWFRRLFGHRPPDVDPVAEVQKILTAYCAILASNTRTVADSSELPYPKNRIKAALVAAIKLSPDPKQREQLKAAYVGLAGWQDGIGPGPGVFEVTQADLNDPISAMKRIAAAGPEFTEIPERVAADGEALFAELKSMGL
jgi:hypothetical protein